MTVLYSLRKVAVPKPYGIDVSSIVISKKMLFPRRGKLCNHGCHEPTSPVSRLAMVASEHGRGDWHRWKQGYSFHYIALPNQQTNSNRQQALRWISASIDLTKSWVRICSGIALTLGMCIIKVSSCMTSVFLEHICPRCFGWGFTRKAIWVATVLSTFATVRPRDSDSLAVSIQSS